MKLRKKKILTKKNNYIYLYICIFILILFLSIGFSAYNNKLSIDNISSIVRVDKDIRVTNVNINEVNSASGYYEDYNVTSISGDVKLDNKDSYIIYEVTIYNLGNVPMGISSASINNDNLKYEFIDYNLKEALCENDKCTLGIKKKIKIKISYKEGANINEVTNHFTLSFNFGRIFNITYFNIPNSNNFPSKIIEGDNLDINIINNTDYFLKVYMNNQLLTEGTDYQYINNNLVVTNINGDIKIYFRMPICQRATVLHTEECSGRYCAALGYTADGSKKTTTITYGSLGTEGVLASGDAFDCDVNGDGVYDSTTERFYYVTDMDENNNIAILIYYNNVSGGIPNNKAFYAYDSSNENWYGPKTAVMELPTKSMWKNVSLSNSERKLTNEYGTNNTKDGHTFPSTFSYSEYAARLLTFQELKKALNIYIPTWQNGELNEHLYFVENTNFAIGKTSSFDGYWLENPRYSLSAYAWFIYTEGRRVHSAEVKRTDVFGVRPVIEVSKNDISY